jgi:hypothetical protein
MNSDQPTQPPASNPAGRFTSLSRVVCIVALAATIGVMYWVIYNNTVSGPPQLLAVGGILLAGILVIAAGAHFSDGRHRK